MIISIIVIALSVILDQVTKLLVVNSLDLYESVEVIPNVFNFTYIHNKGAAFGMLDEHRWVFMVISTVAIVALLVYLFKFAPKNNLLRIGLSLVVGGGIGNMIDRVALGYVVDFLDFCAFDFWVWIFNVADVCVCVGAGIIALYLIIDIINDAKAQKAKKALAADCETEEIKEEDNKENE